MPKGAGFGWPDDGDPLRRGSLALAQAEFAQDPGVGMPYPLVSDERARSRASAVPAVICSFSTGARVPMLGWTRSVVPDSRFVVGRAEALPVAGSLHYVDLGKFFPEASRVLGAEGELVVYDFSPQVNEWFGAFMTRYPTPRFRGEF